MAISELVNMQDIANLTGERLSFCNHLKKTNPDFPVMVKKSGQWILYRRTEVEAFFASYRKQKKSGPAVKLDHHMARVFITGQGRYL